MIKFLGSSYRYQGEKLKFPEVIYIVDHHYNEEDQCFHVQALLENSLCDPHQHIIVFDHVLRHEDILSDYQILSLPLLLIQEADDFIKQNINPVWSNKTKTFNCMINKPRLHREFLLLLIEHFKLSNYSHSLAWQNLSVNKTGLALGTNNSVYRDIILNTDLHINNTNFTFGPEVVMDRGVRNGSYKNSETYQGLLQTTVFEPSCISLITEPAFYERETIITEKTIMSIYGGTIPIWVSGWRIADWMREQGFDVFDDIVDHSYQSLTDPYDRCYQALYNNLELLNNFETVQKFIEQNQDRLQHNLDLLKKNCFLLATQKNINQYPKEVLDHLGVKLF